MKRQFTAAVLALACVLMSTAQTRADTPPCMNPLLSAFCIPFALTTYPGMMSGMTSSSSKDDRAVYLQNLHDDAAEYLANDGETSALLNEAVNELRQNAPWAKGLNDQQIVEQILTNV